MPATRAKRLWRKLGGADLEPVLASGAVALIDAQWVISHAEAGGILTHRQALPKEAFLSLADLVAATVERPGVTSLPIAALSHMWLSKNHPDPDGANLRRVAKALKTLLTDPNVSRLGVFWDFLSLYQHPKPTTYMRTEEQNTLFKQGLGCLGMLYSHPYTTVLRLTSFPDGHKKEDQPEGTNVSEYFDRGWCFTENALSSLTKDSYSSLDLGLMHEDKEYSYDGKASLSAACTAGGGRRPPLLPSQFATELETKTFTNGKDDKPLVKGLYERAFAEQFGQATKLYYGGLGWTGAEAAKLAEVIASTAAPQLQRLGLEHNKFGDEGCKWLSSTLRAAPQLEWLRLDDNQIGDDGLKALAATLREGAAPRLKTLNLIDNQIGNAGLEALASALKAALRLEKLYLENNQNIGDVGYKKLAAALKEGYAPRLKVNSAPPLYSPSPAHMPHRTPLPAGPYRRGLRLKTG